MDMREQFGELAVRLESLTRRCMELRVFLGCDAAVDRILLAVDKRHGPGEAFDPLPTIDSFGKRISAGSGRSANIELHLQQEKVGGNGPIMAGALAPSGVRVRCLGPMGFPNVLPVYQDLASRITVETIDEPVISHAVEFQDGKVILPVLTSYDRITPERILEVVGRERLLAFLEEADLIGLLCWTFMPHMGRIMELVVSELLPSLATKPDRRFFFDLADPAIRTTADLVNVLHKISAFEAFGRTTLGMNLSEATQVCAALGLAVPDEQPSSLREAVTGIREKLNISIAMVHPTGCAACATENGSFDVPGPYCPKPRISTGAGDHLNAGFNLGLLLGLEPTDALSLGVLYSGYYVRTAKSPSFADIIHWIRGEAI